MKKTHDTLHEYDDDCECSECEKKRQQWDAEDKESDMDYDAITGRTEHN